MRSSRTCAAHGTAASWPRRTSRIFPRDRGWSAPRRCCAGTIPSPRRGRADGVHRTWPSRAGDRGNRPGGCSAPPPRRRALAYRAGRRPFVSVNVSPRGCGNRAGQNFGRADEAAAPAPEAPAWADRDRGDRRRGQAPRRAGAPARTGVRVWLDDFGTGFSGLSHLRAWRWTG